MKKKLFSFPICCLFLLVTLFSCRKDLGNYTYHDINDVSIAGINSTYNVKRREVLTIQPSLSSIMPERNDTTLYTYTWTAYAASKGGNQIPIVVATTKDFNTTVTLPSDTYTFYYTVEEKSTGIQWRTKFTVAVNTDISDGWLVMNDMDGYARVDLLNRDPSTGAIAFYKDALSTLANIKLPGKPKVLYFSTRRYFDEKATTRYRNVFVGTDQVTYQLNTSLNSFDNVSLLQDSFLVKTKPAGFHAVNVRCAGGATTFGHFQYLIDSEGNLNYEVTLKNPFGISYNVLATGERLTLSPFIAEAYNKNQNYILLYDTVKKRFIRFQGGTDCAVASVTSGTKYFDPANVGMDLIWMDSTPSNSGKVYALLKSTDNKLYLVRLTAQSSTFIIETYVEVTSLPNLATATQYTIHPSEGYFTYASGSKIYQYNPFDKTTTLMKDYGTDKVVSLIKYQKVAYYTTKTLYKDWATKLLVGSYSTSSPSTTGVLDMFTVPSLNGAWTSYATYSGFGKISAVTLLEIP